MASSTPPADEALPSRGYARYVLGICFAYTALNVLDRQVLSVLVEPVKQELSLSDSRMGLLLGTAFALSHALAMIPLARLADVRSRRNVIVAGLFIWSALTSITGAARAYWHLFVTRIGVGACESVGTGPTHSLLADYFPPERRAAALSIQSSGGTVGAMLGFAVGGILADAVGWRLTFVFFGIPGLLLAGVMLATVREPKRGAIEGLADDKIPALGETLTFLGRLPAFRHVVLTASLNSFVVWSLLSWSTAAMMRGHGLSAAEVGTRLAFSMTLPSALGLVASGFLSDRLGRRDPRWYAWIPAAAGVGAIPFTLAFLLWPDPEVAFWWIVPGAFLNSSWVGTCQAVVQGLAKPRMRATAGSVYSLVNTGLIGQGMGPLLVGILSDRLDSSYGNDSLRFALAFMVVGHLWAAVHSLLCARTLRRDLRAKEA